MSKVTNSYKNFGIWDVVRDIKENVCKLDDKGGEEKLDYELPDG